MIDDIFVPFLWRSFLIVFLFSFVGEHPFMGAHPGGGIMRTVADNEMVKRQ